MKFFQTKLSVFYTSLIFLILVGGIIHASMFSFVNDDCFISFRYAKNLVNGLGLVFNAGERVEGFTNFLWTILIAVGMKFDFDPVLFSTRLGIVFYGLTLLLFAYVSWRNRKNGSWVFVLPITTLALSLHHDFNVYATGGLETSMYTFLVSLAFVLLLYASATRQYFWAGFVLVLAMMTRPDGVLFLTASGLIVLLSSRQPIRHTFFFLIPSVTIFLPYWILRYLYYGYFFPNSFYAKSADLTYYSQGLEYAWLYIKTYYVFALVPLFGAVYLWQKRRLVFSVNLWHTFRERMMEPECMVRGIVLSALMILFYAFFIIRVGGDFMFARFFIPITPLLLYTIEIFLKEATGRSFILPLALGLLLLVLLRNDQFKDEINVGYIVDEERYYSSNNLQETQENGARLKSYFQGLPVRVAFWGAQLRLIYYAEPTYALEGMTGLTDTELAHQILAQRGRPGHEKNATNEFLLHKRIHFFIGPMQVPPRGGLVMNQIVFGNILARIIVYDNTIMDELRRHPDVRFIHVPTYLDEFMTHFDDMPIENVAESYFFFKSFYFDHNQDYERLRRYEEYLRSH